MNLKHLNIKNFSYVFLIMIGYSQSLKADDETIWKQGITIPELFLTSDSEGFSARKISASYLPFYEHGDRNSGVQLQHSRFKQDHWSTSSNQVALITKAINPRTALGYSVNVGVNELDGHSLLTTDSQYGFSLFEKTRLELILNRARVETQRSLDNDIYYTMFGANIEQQVFSRLSAMAMIGDQKFSDSNSRPFVRAKIVADVLPDYGINFQLRYRKFHSTDINVDRNYFNPEDYQETMAAIGFRKKIKGWMYAGTLGFGRQHIDSIPSTQTKLFEFNATSPFVGDIFFRTRMGYSQSGGFQGPDYSYKYLMEELIFSF
jgi:hypothetical protein